MHKTILITGSTDGIGLEAARRLVAQGHHVLLHGRSTKKLAKAVKSLHGLPGGDKVESYLADLSNMDTVESLAKDVAARHQQLDVLVNNAGVFVTPDIVTPDDLDVRFAVNTLAPCLLTQRLLPLMDTSGRVVSLSSAAQSPVDPDALAGQVEFTDDYEAYAQSKLAITMWSHHMALTLEDSPVFIALNPGSLLGTKMVKDGFNMEGKDIGIGADIIVRAALSDEFATATGKYFDNDSGRFAAPHRDVSNGKKSMQVMQAVEAILADLGHPVSLV